MPVIVCVTGGGLPKVNWNVFARAAVARRIRMPRRLTKTTPGTKSMVAPAVAVPVNRICASVVSG